MIVADLTDPATRVPLGYFSTRDFSQDPSNGGALDTHTAINCARDPNVSKPDRSDLGPEGLLFISAHLSPNAKPLLIVNYDVSGSTRIYEVDPDLR